MTIRSYQSGDADQVLALNAANQPEVGPMDQAKLNLLVDQALAVWVVEVGGSIEGMLVLLPDGAEYASPNYAYFSGRHEAFAYVDRIALSPATRGMGHGVALYEWAVAQANAVGKPVLCAEVNTIPANPRSIRFHERFGFAEVHRDRPYGPDEEVAYFELTLEPR